MLAALIRRWGELPAACSRSSRCTVLAGTTQVAIDSRPLAVTRVAFARGSGGVSLRVGRARRVLRPSRSSPRRSWRAVTEISADRSLSSKWHATSAVPEVISLGRSGSPKWSWRWLGLAPRATSVDRGPSQGVVSWGLRPASGGLAAWHKRRLAASFGSLASGVAEWCRAASSLRPSGRVLARVGMLIRVWSCGRRFRECCETVPRKSAVERGRETKRSRLTAAVNPWSSAKGRGRRGRIVLARLVSISGRNTSRSTPIPVGTTA
jgi:hypothetical protein